MTTEPPDPHPFPASYPPPGRLDPNLPPPPTQPPPTQQPLPPAPDQQLPQPPQQAAQYPGQYPAQYPGQPSPGSPPVFLPDPPSSAGFDALPEPPEGSQPALQWGDPTPAPTPPPRPGPPPALSKLAVAAATLGVLVGGGGLALILGLVALLAVRRSGKRGQGLAVMGMVLTVLWAGLAAFLYLAVLSKPELRDAHGVIIRKGEVKVDRLQAGDCLESWSTSVSVNSVTVLPCTQPHNAEVFHTFNLTGSDREFPGDGIVREQSTSTCLDKAKTAIKADDRKNVKVAVLKPIAVSWKRGERAVTCLAVQNTGTISRSVRP